VSRMEGQVRSGGAKAKTGKLGSTRRWAVHEVGGRKALGDDVAGLHQLQGKLESVSVIQTAADDDGVAHEAVTFGEGFDLRSQGERGVHSVGRRSRSERRTPHRASGPEGRAASSGRYRSWWRQHSFLFRRAPGRHVRRVWRAYCRVRCDAEGEAPWARARSRTMLVSVDSPDWESATTRLLR